MHMVESERRVDTKGLTLFKSMIIIITCLVMVTMSYGIVLKMKIYEPKPSIPEKVVTSANWSLIDSFDGIKTNARGGPLYDGHTYYFSIKVPEFKEDVQVKIPKERYDLLLKGDDKLRTKAKFTYKIINNKIDNFNIELLYVTEIGTTDSTEEIGVIRQTEVTPSARPKPN